MRYVDYVDLKYEPKETDVVCTFYVEPEGGNMKEAAGGVAAESSMHAYNAKTKNSENISLLLV